MRPTRRDVDTEIALPADEAQHLSRVLRLEAGDSAGGVQRQGDEFAAVVATVARRVSRCGS